MWYRLAVAAMVQGQGLDRLYWNQGQAIEGTELLRAAGEVDGSLGDCDEVLELQYIYSMGPDGKRPGVYRQREDGTLDPDPVIEVVR